MLDSAKTQTAAQDDPELAALEGIPVAVISDALDALGLANGVLDPTVRRLASRNVVGRARTVSRAKAPANAAQGAVAPELGMGTQALIDACRPGDVVVVASRDTIDFAVWGGNMATRASALGVRGLVTDGAVRDLDEMDEHGLAIFGSATTPRQAFRRMVTLSIDQPILCGGIWVRPNDIIVGDRDGVVVVPPDAVEKVAARAREIVEVERTMQGFIRAGNSLVAAVEKFKAR